MKRIGFFISCALIVYGVSSLLFEILNTNYTWFSVFVWALLNPVFVLLTLASNMAGTMSQMSLFADASTSSLLTATIAYWAWPLSIIAVGAILAKTAKKR